MELKARLPREIDMRLFIAIDLPGEAKSLLAEAAASLSRQADSGNFVPKENFHLTLVFIGETKRVNDCIEVMHSVVRLSGSGPLALSLSGIGSFKSKRGHTWWAGIDDASALGNLANALADGLRSTGLSIEKRSFKPHVTLGRSVVTSRPVSLELPRLSVSIPAVSLMRSDLSGDCPAYTEVASAAL
jgi:2'-5' RNA ligase